MTTTTGDPSSLKTPSSLSGGDFVSRLLAATPPYLYNVPLTPHSFFFSEMLRSFVQSKTEAGTSAASNNNGANVVRRRKRSWRDARERPLELTTKEKSQHHHHHHHHHHSHHQAQSQKDKYYGIPQPQGQPQSQQAQQPSTPPETHVENRFKVHNLPEDSITYGGESNLKRTQSYEQKTSPYSLSEPLKPVDENRADFCKQSHDFYDDSSRRFSSEQLAHQDAMFAAVTHKVKPEESPPQPQIPAEPKTRDSSPERTSHSEEKAKVANPDLNFLAEQRNKLQEFAGRNFLPGLTGVPRLDEQNKNFALSGVGVPSGTDFLPSGPLWYPPYPHSIAQSYPAIDPLHFFIDLRVSGHIWDRKMNERQLPFKSKHCSAFSVPQAKEYNRPLDLTRDEQAATSSGHNNGQTNQRGTHFILRNLNDTYKDIREMEKNLADNSSKSCSSDEHSGKDSQGRSLSKGELSASSASSSGENRPQKEEEGEGKDLRALIGLELVVDYVKEPKEDPNVDEEQSPDVGE
ncbi:uncharacterized protein [Venturia canescens]|uniref:uncharacterized protein n=1 Tax=Venturia canescens TaxID=32260 RepID=UPI001C9CECCD|nr:uncharacterized protein LOC122412133 [Venturia canescens]XP_043277391.1 uncharacterized protein LOC122412133 [Venturia canescens]XP_043277392.1 uncharacterized protein LOC122412133 [Venturia canescens]